MTAAALNRKCRLLAWSPIADDPRVRRMGDALTAAGWDVTGVGLAGAKSAPPAWPIISTPELDVDTRSTAGQGALATLERTGVRAASAVLAPVEQLLQIAGSSYAAPLRDIRKRAITADRPLASFARSLSRQSKRRNEERGLSDDEKMRLRYWRLSPDLNAMKQIVEHLDGPALWVANDWWMLPIADAGQARSGGSIVYDSHELATEEYSEKPEWRRFQRPIVAAVETALISKARIVTSVSPGIRDHLKTQYDLRAPTMTLRNAPSYQETPFRPAGEKIRVLYHGLVRSGRGLETTIESVASWRSEFELTIRGPSEPAYLDALKARVNELGLGSRVTFSDPVPMTELVARARDFDIGIMALPDLSLHTRYALPNKLFEYLMAGLALIVTDLPEMRTLVNTTGAGAVTPDATPAAIAGSINSITREKLDAMRRAALVAARQYNWEVESTPVLAAYADLMDRKD